MALQSFFPNVSNLFKISFNRSTITSTTMVGSNSYSSLNTAPMKSKVLSPLWETQFQRPCNKNFIAENISNLDALEISQNSQMIEMPYFYSIKRFITSCHRGMSKISCDKTLSPKQFPFWLRNNFFNYHDDITMMPSKY